MIRSKSADRSRWNSSSNGWASYVAAVVDAVRRELLVGQRLRPGRRAPRFRRFGEAPLAQAVLHRRDRAPVPGVDGLAEHAAVVEHVAVEVAHALPRDHRGEVGRLSSGDEPLRDRVVADAEQSDLPGAPRLGRGPFDAVVEVSASRRRVRVDGAGGAAPPAGVDPYADVAVGHPLLRVADLPRLVAVVEPASTSGCCLDHRAPSARVAVGEVQALPVWAVAEQDRMEIVVVRPVDVGPQHEPVVHLDRDVVLDLHVSPRVRGSPAAAASTGARVLRARSSCRRRCRPGDARGPRGCRCRRLASSTL